MMNEPISETGPWEVYAPKHDKDVWLSSDDFTHDVLMLITGDFGTRERKIEYAHEIAKRLNAWKGDDNG